MKYIHTIYLLFLSLLLTACDNENVTQVLKEHRIISSIEDREFLPNQIKKEFDWGFIIKDKNGYKLANKDGKILTKAGFVWEPKFNKNGLAIVKLKLDSKSHKYGLIKTNGEYILEPLYDDINNFDKNEISIIEVNKSSYDAKITSQGNKRYKGLINSSGTVLIEPNYFNISYLKNVDLYLIDHHSYQRAEGPLRKSLYSPTKGWIENATYDSISKFKDGFAIVKKNGKSGLINSEANIIIPPIYTTILDANEGLYQVIDNNRQTAFFSNKGKITIPFKEYNPSSFTHGISIVKGPNSNFSKREIGLMNLKGELITDYIFSRVEPFSFYEDLNMTLAIAQPLNSPKQGVINTKGEYLVKPKYRSIKATNNGFFLVSLYKTNKNSKSLGQKYQFYIDIEENIYLDINQKNPKSSLPSEVHKLGLINIQKGVITPPIYDNIHASFNNVISVKQGKHWGIVDQSNNIITPIKYDDIDLITPSVALIKKNNQWGILNIKENKAILPTEFQEINILSANQVKVKKNNKWSTISI